MTPHQTPRILVLCTVSTGLDAVAAVCRRGFELVGIVGLAPDRVNPEAISGYVDVEGFAKVMGVPAHHVRSYSLTDDCDRQTLESLEFDLVWVAGWQRLVPPWLIDRSRLGVIGGHGSPDGITGGRGRSPQNWALLLGCSQFDLALFRITAGVDDGPIILQRTFFYRPDDDISTSYYRASLAMAEMVCEVLTFPELLVRGYTQPVVGQYFPQRRPEDGVADWFQPAATIARHCRALTKPYPGLRTAAGVTNVTMWACSAFDDKLDGLPGEISNCFVSGDFLVNCLDGRLLVRSWSASDAVWRPKAGVQLKSVPFRDQLRVIVDRHRARFPDQTISPRVRLHLESGPMAE